MHIIAQQPFTDASYESTSYQWTRHHSTDQPVPSFSYTTTSYQWARHDNTVANFYYRRLTELRFTRGLVIITRPQHFQLYVTLLYLTSGHIILAQSPPFTIVSYTTTPYRHRALSSQHRPPFLTASYTTVSDQ